MLRLKKLERPLYKGKGPKGANWFPTLVPITSQPVIDAIFHGKKPPDTGVEPSTHAIPAMFISQILAIAGTNDLHARIVTQQRRDEHYAHSLRLQGTRRLIDDQAPDFALAAGFQPGCHNFDVWTLEKTSLRIELVERTFDKAHKVVTQK